MSILVNTASNWQTFLGKKTAYETAVTDHGSNSVEVRDAAKAMNAELRLCFVDLGLNPPF